MSGHCSLELLYASAVHGPWLWHQNSQQQRSVKLADPTQSRGLRAAGQSVAIQIPTENGMRKTPTKNVGEGTLGTGQTQSECKCWIFFLKRFSQNPPHVRKTIESVSPLCSCAEKGTRGNIPEGSGFLS